MSAVNQDLANAPSVSCLRLFWTYFRIGLMTFGGGFAMAAVMRHELVLRRRWLTDREFVDVLSRATAVPGAIAVNLAFVEGRRLAGMRGAATAAAGTVCPSVLVMLLIVRFGAPYFDHPAVAAFLKGCAIAVAGQIAFSALTFARRLRRTWQNAFVGAAGLAVAVFGPHPIWAVLVAAGLGYLLMRERMAVREETEEGLALLKLIEGIPAQELLGEHYGADLREIIYYPHDRLRGRVRALLEKAPVLDLKGAVSSDELLELVGQELGGPAPAERSALAAALKHREAASSTAVSPSVALPHVVVDGQNVLKMALVRCRGGAFFSEQAPQVRIVFVLVGSLDMRECYLACIAGLAQMAAREGFLDQWLRADGVRGLRNLVVTARRECAELL
ncbi:MAG: PTS transporter subunit EIIA [Candidatus Brocadiaceae bacterium]|nr:PTS transporter subunit EIIA [Candidatus Brocadiaceae bacterium]